MCDFPGPSYRALHNLLPYKEPCTLSHHPEIPLIHATPHVMLGTSLPLLCPTFLYFHFYLFRISRFRPAFAVLRFLFVMEAALDLVFVNFVVKEEETF